MLQLIRCQVDFFIQIKNTDCIIKSDILFKRKIMDKDPSKIFHLPNVPDDDFHHHNRHPIRISLIFPTVEIIKS